MNRKLLIVEIRIADETDFDPSQVVPITIYQDDRNHYYSTDRMKEIKRAMGDAVVNFGNNFRHPLLYDAQVIPGDEIDAVMASMNRNFNTLRQRRRVRRN